MNSNRYSIVRFNPLFSACLIVVLLSLSSILLAQDPWTKLVDMPTARLAFGTAVVDGKIYVIGGAQNETVPLAVVEVYDPDTDSWDTNKTPMPKPKGGFGCAVVDGKIYVMGGGVVGIEKLSDVWMYDPATDTWDTTLTDMNVARFTLAADTVNGKIYAIGGADTVGVPILWGISTVEEYDPVADEWIFKTDKPTAGWGLRACTLGGKIYVTGGNIMWPDISAALEVYDPTTDSWDTTRTPMSEEKYSHSTIVINGKIYAFGGWDNSGYGPMYDDVDTYDPERDHWLERTAMPLELAEFGAAVVNNKAYIIGGTSTLHPFTSMNTVYKYDPASDWFHGQIAHGETLSAHPKYVAPQTETLIVNAKLHNPNQHAVMVYAMIQSDDHSYQDSLEMFDNGLHPDSSAGDGIWGAQCMTPPEEGMYKVSIKTVDMDSGITINSLLFNIYDRFTTIGPVEFESYQIIDTLFQTTYQIKLLLRNKGLSEMAPGITAELSSSDTNVTNISALNNDPIDIPAGQAVETEQIFNIGTKGSPSNVIIHINLYSNGYHYWSDSLNFLAINISESKYNLPIKYSLSQNYPNPFNPKTIINYELPITNFVELSIYNVLGQKVETLVSRRQKAGFYTVEWDAGHYSSGVYYYMIKVGDPTGRTGEWQDVRKMILLR